jgi:hypothetical protein
MLIGKETVHGAWPFTGIPWNLDYELVINLAGEGYMPPIKWLPSDNIYSTDLTCKLSYRNFVISGSVTGDIYLMAGSGIVN